ncbi:DUF2182 domain-containing protein [Rhizobium sp. P38BS-XIX]|uniref:copper chaperone n=1 Tax=Rhizobium sp. P38BS-XIX TaxID=2726740 RepID=UPI001457425F|nr:DUF2182 domain-containing protein [Rhizobium sp. P38BS-XIX]NLS00686.1 DUF2182 domain-containing protein [Rhizobium sp. P38BS-XIX]
MRAASVAWLPFLQVPRPFLLATLAGWVLMIGSSAIPTLPDLCVSGSMAQAVLAKTSAAFASGDLVAAIFSWSAMMLAMMAPLVAAPWLHVWRQSLRHYRWHAGSLFLLVYVLIWMALGVLLVPIAVIIRASFADSDVVPAALGLGVAVVWQMTPAKQAFLNACHRRPALSAFGSEAVSDIVGFGLSQARSCVGTCWAFMLCSLLVSGPAHWAVMAAVLLFSMFERSRAPRRPQWLAAPGFVAFHIFRLAPFPGRGSQ